MKDTIDTILKANSNLLFKKSTSIYFEKDFEGKGLLNKEISKFYSKNITISSQEFVEIIINCHVIIEKMRKLKKCSWSISELQSQLESGVYNYQIQKEKLKQINATTIGKHFNISSQRLNLILSELGWIEKNISGWIITKLGKTLGGIQYEHDTSGGSYVLWPDYVLENKNLKNIFKEFPSSVEQQKENKEKETIIISSQSENFREKFPATFRTKDGHWVRSRAEVIIDNALYDYKLAHAYERKLPIEEELYSDFFIPTENVYIEFWGMEDDPKYAERKKTKIAIYAKYDFKLIELTDQDIFNLDDHLPKKLLKFGIKVY